jgi:hypothetical protein
MKILLTATVTPQVTWDLHIKDPATRRRQYLESLRGWLPEARRLGAIVVLVENSGEDLERLAIDAVGEVPANLRLVPTEAPSKADVQRGKGSAEAAMLDHFCQHFYHDSTEFWLKCTGRLFVRNLPRCMPSDYPEDAILARVPVSLKQMDTRFFGTTAGIWREHFVGAGISVRDREEIFLEKVLIRRAFGAMSQGANLVHFDVPPSFMGRSATHADRIYDSPASQVKRLATSRLEALLKGPLWGKYF